MKPNCLIAAVLALSMPVCGCDIDWNEDGESEPITLTKAQQEMSADVNAFGFDVFNALNANEPAGQIFISPMSLSLSLSMTCAGAQGRTAEQMLDVLGFKGFTTGEMNDYFHTLVSGLEKSDTKTTFRSANSIWASKSITLKDGFISDVTDYYEALVKSVDFSKSSTVNEINSWCSRQTNGKIKKIKDELDPELMLALINALYFKGTWEEEFEDEVETTFTGISGTKSRRSLMSDCAERRYAHKEKMQMVELPYGNGNFVMDVILPDEGVDFKKIASSFNDTQWKSLTSTLRRYRVDLRMPSFRMEYSVEFQDILSKLGMPLALSASADFSLISDTPLFISEVLQKTYVDVNAKGTEAAAVTFIGMKATALPDELQYVEMEVNRPFIFVIRELTSGTILFIGQYVG